jgi:quinol monooxygenase YgiN
MDGPQGAGAHLSLPHMLAYREDVKALVVGTKLQVLQPA